MKRLLVSVLLGALVLSLGQAGQKLRYKFEQGKTYRYEIHANNSVTGQAQGQDFTADSKTKLVIGLVLDKTLPDGSVELIGSFESFQSTLNIPMMGMRDTTIDFADLAGKRVRITMTPRGKTTAIATIDTMPRNMLLSMSGGQPADLFRRVMPELPEQEIAEKGTWTQAQPETTKTSGMTVVSKPNVTFTVAGSEAHNEHACWKITFTGTVTTEGSGTMRGVDVTTDGSVKTAGTIFLAPKEGILVDYQSTYDADQTQTFSGAQTGSQSMQMKITSSSTLLK